MSHHWSRLLAAATTQLHNAGVSSARVDAELLAAFVAQCPRGQLLIAEPPDMAQQQRFTELVAQRSKRIPLQHLTGAAPFWRSELAVGAGVFVPRPETELVVEWALRELADIAAPTVVDLCAGSGAIGAALQSERADATVYLVERYDAALDWLRHNVAETAAHVIDGDAIDPQILASIDGQCDAVLTNPPYIPQDIAVSPEVAFDPSSALYGGADGLDVIRPLIKRAHALLRAGGIIAIEHDDTHEQAVPQLLRSTGFVNVVDHRDLADRPRFATANKPG